MTEPKKFWLLDGEGVACLATGAPVRDTLLAQGWAEIDEPSAVTQVHVYNEELDARTTLPAGALDLWETRGWHAVEPPPPEPYAPGATVPEAPAVPVPSAPAPVPSEPAAKPKTAAAGDDDPKEK
jgi:hypothetical protein